MITIHGESLHKRGYKTATNIAPINEVLAAGLVMLKLVAFKVFNIG